jgi:hypothetical protein
LKKLLTEIVAIALKAGQAILEVHADPANAHAVVKYAGGKVAIGLVQNWSITSRICTIPNFSSCRCNISICL